VGASPIVRSESLCLTERQMSSWVPMFALPNVDVDEPIEVDGMALVSLRDYRIHELANKHKNFAEYR
jgi:hypothetical protein